MGVLEQQNQGQQQQQPESGTRSMEVLRQQKQQQPGRAAALGRTRTILFTLLVSLGCMAVLHLGSGSARFLRTASSAALHKKATYKEISYGGDDDSWDRHNPKVVILAGPHKTASTTLQNFMVDLAGQKVDLYGTNTKKKNKRNPHPSNQKWVWPLPNKSEFAKLGGRVAQKGAKTYAPFASYITGRRARHFFPSSNLVEGKPKQVQIETVREWSDEKIAYFPTVKDYYQTLFSKVWKKEKNIVIGAEAMDTFVMALSNERGYEKDGVTKRVGEALHVPLDSDMMMQRLLELFQWNEDDGNDATKTDVSHNGRRPPPKLEDFEVQINYRAPRIHHVVSIWHQLSRRGDQTLKTFLLRKTSELYQANSLALALQFARNGIKTTIVDMKGVYEKEERQQLDVAANSTTLIIGGLKGVIACDILQMGTGKNGINDNDQNRNGKHTDIDALWCDEHSRLHLPPPVFKVTNKNKKSDPAEQDISDAQLIEIERALVDYDCEVWKHLKPYTLKGTLRILHPSKHLFSKCNDDAPEVSFRETTDKIKAIVSEQ